MGLRAHIDPRSTNYMAGGVALKPAWSAWR